ncbi:MAG: chromosomal replication initiator protein DnaA [Bacteroidaceae bacterium]|nr:chromosomal replication initiator protein DnaA [Bacteroidaceae bacterium]
MKQELKEMWDKCAIIIKDNITPEQYDTWFACIEPRSYTDGQLMLAVPSQFVYERLETVYIDLIYKVITRVFGSGIKLCYTIRQIQTNQADDQQTAETTVAHDTATTPAATADFDSQLNPRYTFDNFIEGDSNRLARSVGQAIAKNPAKTFNPLFIYGPSGCGKTHLANAIGWSIKQQHPEMRVLYLSAHLFHVQYVNAVRQNKTNEFISFYQTIDALILDDTHELAGQTKTQNTFFHIFNHLHLTGKQIILTADRPPIAISGLEERLLTRFKWGLQAEIERPTKALCRAILRYKAKQDAIPIPEAVINYIADRAAGSVRDLEGILNSLVAHSVVYKCDINMKLADLVMPRFVKADDTPLTLTQIKRYLCQHYNISEAELCSQTRRQPINQIRQTAIYLASKLTNHTNTQIGQQLGGRTHATVIHAIRHIQQLADVDTKLNQELQELEDEIRRSR